MRLFCLFFACALTLIGTGTAHAQYVHNDLFNSNNGFLVGNAAISGGVLHLTDAVNSQNGTWLLNPGQRLGALQMQCDVRIGGGTGTGADGFSFSYSDLDGSSLGDFGDATPGLAIRMVTYTTNQLIVLYNSATVATVNIPHATIRQNAFVPFRVVVNNQGFIQVSYNNTQYVNTTIPGWNPQSTWRMAFGARTGGANDNHWVDNLTVRGAEPTTSSITRLNGANINAATGSVQYRADFTDAVQNVGTADFGLTATGSAAATIASVTGPTINVVDNFNSGLTTGTIIGNAQAVNGRIQLTEAVNGQTGGWYFTPAIYAANAFTARFDLLIGNGNGADGLAFAYGPAAGGAFGGEGPAGTGLVVSFDTYENGGEGTPNITIRYNGVDQAVMSQVLRTGTFVPVVISMRNNGLCTVWHNNELIASATIAGWAPQTSWIFGVGAATGGLNDQHYIDNMNIQNGSYNVTLNAISGVGTLRMDVLGSNDLIDRWSSRLTPAAFTTGELYNVDTVSPVATLASAAGNPVGGAIAMTVNTGEATTTFASGDISTSNATVTGFAGSGSSYTFNLVPTADGLFSATINANVYTDGFGNFNTASATVSRTFDGTSPDVTLSAPPANPVNGSVAVTVTLSEPVVTFGPGNITLTNATVSNFAGSGAAYTLDLVPTVNGLFSAIVNAGQFADSVGNLNTVSNSISRTYDGTAPTVALAAAPADPVNGAIAVTVTLGESVTTFDAGDLTPTNATISNFAGSGASYTFDLVPQADGLVSVVVNAGAFQDAAGNGNTVSNTLTRTFDGTAPSAVLSSAANPVVNNPLAVTVTVSEPVTNLVAGDITPTNATVSGFSGSGTAYSFSLNPLSSGNFSAIINAGAFSDAAGNANPASNTISRVFDNVLPTIASRVPAAGATVGSLPTVSVTFDDEVTGVDPTDLLVKGSAATSVTGTSPGPFVFSGFNPPGSGNAAVVMQAGGITDDGNNPFLGANWTYTINTTVPTVQLTSVHVADGGATNGPATLNFAATFSEGVTGFTLGDVTVTNATKAAFGGSGASYTFTITPLAEGPVTVEIPASAATATAPPNNPNPSSGVFTFSFDTTDPVIVINGNASETVNCGDGYTDPGVQSATDNIDGNVISLVNVGGDTVTNTTPPGNYAITYSYTDTAGNSALETRAVEVLNNCPLAIAATGATGGIQTGPLDFTVDGGTSIILQVSVTGAIGPVTYDWRKDIGGGNFVSIGALDSPNYTINSFTPSKAGMYRCEVSDAVASATSGVLTLTFGAANMPVAGGAGLAALAALSGALGVMGMRRRKR